MVNTSWHYSCPLLLCPIRLVSPIWPIINSPDRPLASFEFLWTNVKTVMALWGLFIISAGALYFTLLPSREKNIRKEGAGRNWTLLSFSFWIAHLRANSLQYCLTSNFEWLEWGRFSFQSFNLLFQFCKWDRYWLWRSSWRKKWSLFPELRCPAAPCYNLKRKKENSNIILYSALLQ